MQHIRAQRIAEALHPATILIFCTAILCFTMFVVQPVYVGISLISAIVTSALLLGGWSLIAKLKWQVPLVIAITLINTCISHTGETVLWSVGAIRFTLESFAYGLTLGCTLIAVMLWLEISATLVSEDALMEVFGKRFPTITTMLSIANALLPQMLSRYHTLLDVSHACTSSRTPQKTGKSAQVLMGGILLSWSLDDSIGRSDAMRARGWGVSKQRSSYTNWIFTSRDALFCVVIGVLTLTNAYLSAQALSQWQFYPVMPQLCLWWGYIVYAIFALVPLLLFIQDALAWRRNS